MYRTKRSALVLNFKCCTTNSAQTTLKLYAIFDFQRTFQRLSLAFKALHDATDKAPRLQVIKPVKLAYSKVKLTAGFKNKVSFISSLLTARQCIEWKHHVSTKFSSRIHPPMSIIGLLFAIFLMLNIPACLAFFFLTATLTRARSSSLEAPSLRGPSRSTPEAPNRQTYRAVSLVHSIAVLGVP